MHVSYGSVTLPPAWGPPLHYEHLRRTADPGHDPGQDHQPVMALCHCMLEKAPPFDSTSMAIYGHVSRVSQGSIWILSRPFWTQAEAALGISRPEASAARAPGTDQRDRWRTSLAAPEVSPERRTRRGRSG